MEGFNLLIKNIEKHLRLSEAEIEDLRQFFTFKKLRKKQYFLQEGDISHYSAFVISGCMRSYYVDINGFEHILQFAIEDWWITDMMSFTKKTEAKLNIDALEDTEMLLITREQQLSLFDKIPKLEKYFRIITENGLISYQSRLLESMSLHAPERYANFIKRYPALNKRLPQTQIAAYLGITPVFLSKIRNNNNQ